MGGEDDGNLGEILDFRDPSCLDSHIPIFSGSGTISFDHSTNMTHMTSEGPKKSLFFLGIDVGKFVAGLR